MLTEQTVPCQMCRGSGHIGPVHINRGEQPHEWREKMNCLDCGGAGSWDMQRWERWQIGQEHRRSRLNRDESILECSKRLGVGCAELSAYERGQWEKVNPALLAASPPATEAK